MRIVNLTQHLATPEQKAAGVFDLEGGELARLKQLLTFEALPDADEILERAAKIVTLGANRYPLPEAAMIGGALWLMAPLARELRTTGIKPIFAFSIRDSKEEVQPDGSVLKVSVFRPIDFVPAVE